MFVLPNLYGDIITDEAAEFQGGVGTAGSANIGKRYAMFEAIHGSAPRMVDEGPRPVRRPVFSMLRASGDAAVPHRIPGRRRTSSTAALDKCMFTEKALHRHRAATPAAPATEFGDYVMRTIETL